MKGRWKSPTWKERNRLSADIYSYSLESLSQDPKKIFANKIHTDGSSVVFIFSRKAKPAIKKVELELSDFTPAEVNELFQPCAVDPGRTNAYTVAYGYGTESHMVLRYTTKEYYRSLQTTAEQRFQGKKEETGVAELEKSMPTPKTSDKAKYLEYVTYVLAHVPELYQFYGIQDGKLKYFKYKSKQKAISEAVNILVNGGKKYRKIKNGNTKRNRRRKRRKKERSNEYIRWVELRLHGK